MIAKSWLFAYGQRRHYQSRQVGCTLAIMILLPSYVRHRWWGEFGEEGRVWKRQPLGVDGDEMDEQAKRKDMAKKK
jgi:hypothetical protein